MRHSFHSARILRYMRKPLISMMTAGACLFFYPYHAFTAPTNGTVSGGSATISVSGNSTLINQGSARAVLDWRSFDISPGELVQFIQPGASSVALNRINGGDATTILGQLTANGRVFISNPNGVVFGQGAKVDVAGLLATTLTIDADSFMQGGNAFTQQQGIDPSFVVNRGEIVVRDNGFCFLVAPGVENQGSIVAQLGKVVMASGDALTIDFNGDGLLTYNVSGKVLENVIGPDGKPFQASVSNSGSVKAEGGSIVMVSNAGGEAFASAVNNSGVLEAGSLVASGGSVLLAAGDEGIAQNSGTIDVSAKEAGAAPGSVEISGRFAGNFGTIRAKGATDADGGSVTLSSTVHTLAGSDSVIDVSGSDNSSAGSILLWSDNHATLGGSVLARGGENAGDGGFVDVSSKGQVDLVGTVDLLAPVGESGTLLIDPKNIIVQISGSAAYTDVDQFSDNSSATTTVSPVTLDAVAGNIVLQANNDITVSDAISLTTSGASLTMQAGRDININNVISTADGAIIFTANDDEAISINRDSGTGDIVMAAGTTIDAGSGDITLTIDPDGSSPGAITLGDITTTGNVTLSSAGTIVETNGAAIDITGSSVSITTTGIGSTIGSSADYLEVSATDHLDVSTHDGNVYLDMGGGDTIEFVSSTSTLDIDYASTGMASIGFENNDGDVLVNRIDVTNALELSVTATDGAITATPATTLTPNIIAGAATLVTQGKSGGAIGATGSEIYTELEGISALANHGGIYIIEKDGLAVNSVIARESLNFGTDPGLMPTLNPSTGQVRLGNTATSGTFDVSITASGNIALGTVTAPDVATVTTDSGTIIDINDEPITDPVTGELVGIIENNNVTARTVFLEATDDIGVSTTDPLEMLVENTNATTTDGNIALALGNKSVISSVTADGDGSDVLITGSAGDLSIGTITAGTVADRGNVTIDNSADASGALLDNNGATLNITGDNLVLKGRTGIGSSLDPLETTVNTVTAEAINASAGIYLANTGSLQSVDASSNKGDVSITFTGGGTFVFNASTTLFSASGLSYIAFENTSLNTPGGNVTIDVVNAGSTGEVHLTAGKSILDNSESGTLDIVAAKASLTAGGTIGSSTDHIETSVDEVQASAAGGGVYLDNNKALELTASAAGSGNDIAVSTSVGGLVLHEVSAPDDVTLSSAAAISSSVPGETVITATDAILNANGGAIGSINTKLSSVDATAAGAITIVNKGSLDLAADAGGNIDVATTGGMTLTEINATAGNDVKLSAGGPMLDGNGVALNITANAVDLSAQQIGESSDPVETAVAEMTLYASNGGIYIDNTSSVLELYSAKAVGSGGDVEIESSSNIGLGEIIADGDDVVLTSGGAITGGNGIDVNIKAANLAITGPDGISDQLVYDVSGGITPDGGTNPVVINNASPLFVSDAMLEASAGSSGSLTFVAPSIIILDFADDRADADGSIVLRTSSGNIVFLDTEDTIYSPGSITIDAGSASSNSGAVAIVGNLETDGGDITVKADSNISIGLLDTGLSAGHVSVDALHGIILDGNGSDLNIIAASADLNGDAAYPQDADLREEFAISESAAADAELRVHEERLETFEVGIVPLITAKTVADIAVTLAEADLAAKEVAKKNADDAVEPLADAVLGLTIASQALDIANTVAGTIAAIAQAVPFTGDGGAATAAFVITATKNATDVALMITEQFLDEAEAKAETAANAVVLADANLYAAEGDLAVVTANVDSFSDMIDRTEIAVYNAKIMSEAAAKVQQQAIDACTNSYIGIQYSANVIGTPTLPLGIRVPGRVDIDAGHSNVYLAADGDVTLGNITAGDNWIAGQNLIDITSTGTIYIQGEVSSEYLVMLDAANSILQDGTSGLVSGVEFVASAGTGIGTSSVPVETSIDHFAGDGGTGGVSIHNDKDLVITTVEGVTGITAGGVVTSAISSDGLLTVEKSIMAGADGSLQLTGGTGVAFTDDGDLSTSGTGAISVTAQANDITMADGTVFDNQTGAVTLLADGSVHLGTIDSASGPVSVTATNGSITDNTTAEDPNISTTGQVTLTAATGIGASGADDIDTDIDLLQATNNTSGDIFIQEVDGLTINGTGIRTLGGDGSIDIDVDAGDLTVNGVVAAHGDGNITLNADGGATGGLVDINAAISSTSGDIRVTGDVIIADATVATNGSGYIVMQTDDGNMTVNSGVTAAGSGNVLLQALAADTDITANADVMSGTGNISVIAARNVTFTANADILTSGAGTVDVEATSGSITMSASSLFDPPSGNTGDIRLLAHNNVIVGDIETGGNVSIIAETGIITDADAASDNDPDLNPDVKANGLRLWAGVGVGELGVSEDALETDVSTVSARATSGGITILENDDLVVDDVSVTVQRVKDDGTTETVTDLAQSDVRTTSGDGDIVVRTTAGHITLNDGTQPDDDTAISAHGSGNVLLEAIGAGTDIVAEANADIESTTGHISLTMAPDATMNTVDGDIRITAGDDVLDQVTIGVITATNGNVSIVTPGSILDSDTVTPGNDDTTEDILAIGLRLDAGKGVGVLAGNSLSQDVNAIETNVGTLSALVRGSDGINILESNGLAINDVISQVNTGVAVSVQTVALDATTSESTETIQSDLLTTNTNGDNGSIVVRTTAGGNISVLAAEDVTFTAGADIRTSGGGTIDVVAGTGSITMDPTSVFRTSGTGGDIELLADQNVIAGILDADENISVTTTQGSIQVNSAVTSTRGDIALTGASGVTHGANGDMSTGDPGTISVTALAGGITMDEQTSYTVGTGTVDLDAVGDVTLGTITGSTAATVVTVAAHDGSILEAGNDTGAEIIAHTVNLGADGSGRTIGLQTNALEIATTLLNAETEAGSIWLTDTDGGVQVGLVNSGGTMGGDVTLTALGGSITELGGDAGAEIIGNRVTLGVTGPASTIGTSSNALEIDAVTLNATTPRGSVWLTDTSGGVGIGSISTGIGAVTLIAKGGSITESGGDSAADIAAGTINLTATGSGSTIGMQTNALEIDGSILNAQTEGGSMWVTDTAGGIKAGLVNAGDTMGGDVTLSAAGGSITESGSDTTADIIGNRITLAVTGPTSTIGTSSNSLEIDAATLNATTPRGSMWLTDVAGGVGIGSIKAGVGTVNLTALNGSIVESGSDSAPEIEANTVNLAVTGAGTVGTASNALALNAVNLNIDTEGGSVWVSDTDGGVAVGLIDAGGILGGDINLAAVNGSITESGMDGTVDLLGRFVYLTASNPYTIGTSTNPLEVTSSDSKAYTPPGVASYVIYLPD